jgi:TetR/AcrR family transcriptional regulator, mexJK operon transcriptional repressor
MTIAVAGVKKGRKYGQVLDGARTVFLRDGFEGASVDDIAQEAGVSKATLYSYFPDKRLLFLEVARTECARQAQSALELTDDKAPPRQVLTAAARRLVSFVTSDFGKKIFRVCVAESDRFPELGRAFYESGPQLVHRRISDYLRAARDRGELRIEDVELAADQFAELCKAGIHSKLIFGAAACGRQDMERTIEGAVDMFLARYGTGRPG